MNAREGPGTRQTNGRWTPAKICQAGHVPVAVELDAISNGSLSSPVVQRLCRQFRTLRHYSRRRRDPEEARAIIGEEVLADRQSRLGVGLSHESRGGFLAQPEADYKRRRDASRPSRLAAGLMSAMAEMRKSICEPEWGS
ncbi:hypothetical protein PDE_00399 [Penicillium oxalicum 114-2]|uniref:Uncharacterized protein n=1 Tax=Penicillium oxalicum (strain 114-2 / CGMCC 5302) TaxID=933388 RepID=S7Z9W2_PENO1|nr:hypothetical protein PDE_00399 [Penicillium oxalicum 114-2]